MCVGFTSPYHPCMHKVWWDCGICGSVSPGAPLTLTIRARTDVAMRLFIAAFMLIHIVYVNHALARPSMTGKAVPSVGDVGEHYPLFLIEKSYHPDPTPLVHPHLPTDCRLTPERQPRSLPTPAFS